MGVLNTRVHGALDYLIGLALVALPWALGFARGGAETWAPVGAGAALLAYSLATDYELGVVRRLQMPVHLWLDAVAGVFLVVSPWLLGFDEHVWTPHVVAGVLLVVAPLFSSTIPGYDRRRTRPAA